MAKKDKKKSKKKDNPGADAVGAVRTAVERTFHATADQAQSTRTRAQDLVDEVAGAAGRLREMVDQLGVLEDLKKQVEALTSRVAALEKGKGAKPASSSRSTSSRSTSSRAKSGSTARKPAAKKSAARKPAASRAKASSSGTRKTTRSSAAKKSS
jgi:hypothetical protein